MAVFVMLLMLITMGISNMAAAITPSSTATITVTGIKGPTKVELYSVLSVSIDAATNTPKTPMYLWNPAVMDWVKAYDAKHATNYIDTIDGIDNVVTDEFNNTMDTKKQDEFWQEMAKDIRNKNLGLGASEVKYSTNNSDIMFTDIAMSGYLLLATPNPTSSDKFNTRIYKPTTALVTPKHSGGSWNLENVEVELKSSDGTIEKTVDDQTVEVGQNLTYTISTTIPAYAPDAIDKYVKVGDKFPDGLTYNKDVKVYADKNCTNELTTGFTKNETANTTETFSVQFDDAFVTAHGGEVVYLRYTATVNKDVDNEMLNNAFVTGPFQYGGETSVKVHSYALLLHKTGENDAKLSGAQFSLKKKGAASELEFIKTADGVYRLAEKTETGKTTVLTTGASGNLQVNGISTGQYILKETKAPDGYVIPNGEITITLIDNEPDGVLDEGSGITKTGSIQVGDTVQKNDITLEFTVINGKGFDLPVTGGSGTLLFTVLGLALMGGAAAVVIAMRRKERKSH